LINHLKTYFKSSFKYDFTAGIVIFLIAVPLCLGVALASGAPLYSGIISGIIGGIIVGYLSPSSISVSGPAAGMAAIMVAAFAEFHDFDTILLAIFISGILQFLGGTRRYGFYADYAPASVIKGMISAIGIMLVIKQIPLAFTMSHNFAELKYHLLEASESSKMHPLIDLSFHLNSGAFILSFMTLSILFFFDKCSKSQFKKFPALILVIILGVVLNQWLLASDSIFAQHGPHLVKVPTPYHLSAFLDKLSTPNWSAWKNPMIYVYAVLFAIATSIESLLNTTACEKLDKKHRSINKNKELRAQGIGNIVAGLLGGMPITSLIIRTSVNIESQAKTKVATIFQGTLLIGAFFFLSEILNHIPVCVLASILIYTGYKITRPKLYFQIYREGPIKFIPFIVTVLSVLVFNLLFGVILGLIVNILYILKYNSQARIDIIKEIYPSGITNRLMLPQQTTFLNKASMVAELDTIPEHAQLIIDARYAQFIDTEILDYIREFKEEQAPLRNISLNLIGFKEHYEIHDHINFINVSTYDAQTHLNPKEVLNILKQGNERFLHDQCIHRSNMIDIQHTSETQHPIAIVLGCIDSRVPVETIFDMTFGDLFCVRIAGNVINDDILASIEYATHVVGAKLIVVLGHTGCGAIQAACNHVEQGHITQLLEKITPAIHAENDISYQRHGKNQHFVHQVTHLNIAHSMIEIYHRSEILKNLIEDDKVGIVGAVYNVSTGKVAFSNYAKQIEAFKDYDSTTLIGASQSLYPD
jgi:carbonic anhydrase